MITRLQKFSDSFCDIHQLPRLKSVEFTAIRRANGLYHYKLSTVEESRISLSSGMKEHFGFKEIMETLLHELTHHYCYCKFGIEEIGHGETFKRYCSMFGGKMNENIAGEEYASAASESYVSKEISFRLYCSCGKAWSREYVKMPTVSSMRNRYCRTCKETMDKWKKR